MVLRYLDVCIGCHECLRIPDDICLTDGAIGLGDEAVEIDEIDCYVKDRVDYEVEGDAILKDVDEVLDVEVNFVVGVQNAVCMIGDIQLLLDEGCHVAVMDSAKDKLTVDEFLKLNADDKLNGDDLVDEVVRRTESDDFLAVDVNEVVKRKVDEVVDVDLDTFGQG